MSYIHFGNVGAWNFPSHSPFQCLEFHFQVWVVTDFSKMWRNFGRFPPSVPPAGEPLRTCVPCCALAGCLAILSALLDLELTPQAGLAVLGMLRVSTSEFGIVWRSDFLDIKWLECFGSAVQDSNFAVFVEIWFMWYLLLFSSVFLHFVPKPLRPPKSHEPTQKSKRKCHPGVDSHQAYMMLLQNWM